MLKFMGLLTGLTMAVTASAQAQVVSVGTTEGGAVAQLGAAVSSVVSSNADIQMRPQAMAGTQQYMSGVDFGRIDFGISNLMQYYMGVTGTGLSEGEPLKNVRIVATLAPFVQGVLVSKASGIHSIAELKGKRIPSGYSASPLFDTFWRGFLASEGLSSADVVPVPVTSLPRSWDAFKQGDVDAVIAAAGSAAVLEMDATIAGGIRYIQIQGNEALLTELPRTRVETVEPAGGLAAIDAPTSLHVYDTVLFANVNVPDDVVYKVVKSLATNEAALKASGPLWAGYTAKRVGADHQLEYHPGAMRYFKEAGLASE